MSLEQRNSNELHSVLIASVNSSRQPYFHLLVWWLIVSLFGFFLYIAWDLGHLRLIYERDRSYLTVVISLLAVFASVHAFYHIAQKSVWLNRARNQPTTGHTQHAESSAGSPVQLIESVSAQVRGPVDTGWFLVDLAIRLGLAGTIIGFILIFTSLSGETIAGENALRELLVSMSTGMGTALFTTLTGLVVATYLSFQYLVLGKLIDHIDTHVALNASSQSAMQ